MSRQGDTVDEDKVSYFIPFVSPSFLVSGGFSDLSVCRELHPLLQRTSMFILMLL